MRVKYLAQEHNYKTSPTRALTRTALSRVKYINREATAHPQIGNCSRRTIFCIRLQMNMSVCLSVHKGDPRLIPYDYPFFYHLLLT